MSLSNKYGIPQETVNQMVKDGVISCSWPMYEEVFSMYQTLMRESGAIKSHVIISISEKKGLSERHVREIINHKFK